MSGPRARFARRGSEAATPQGWQRENGPQRQANFDDFCFALPQVTLPIMTGRPGKFKCKVIFPRAFKCDLNLSAHGKKGPTLTGKLYL